MSIIHVYNEIGKLNKVLMHKPGEEFLNLTPNNLHRLLFDDIPFLKRAQIEHDQFATALRNEGVEVLYLIDLVTEALEINASVKEEFIKEFIDEAGIQSDKAKQILFNFFNKFENNKELVSKAIAGVDDKEIKDCIDDSGFYASKETGKMLIDPLPNLYAPRDPFASIGNGASLHKMKTVTRSRETIFGKYIFKYHPDFKDTKMYYDRCNTYSIEGGDIQVLSKNVVAVGVSERTEPDAIAILAKNLFKDETNEIKTVLAFDIPSERSFMHLDTVMTQVDYDKFLVHPGVMDISSSYEITDAGDGELKITSIDMPLDKILEKYLNKEKITLIKCGNNDRIASEREQWSDGANVLCIRPGVVIAYERNFVTNKALIDNGIRVIPIVDCELSRGRGGPHCLSMAIIREDVE